MLNTDKVSVWFNSYQCDFNFQDPQQLIRAKQMLVQG